MCRINYSGARSWRLWPDIFSGAFARLLAALSICLTCLQAQAIVIDFSDLAGAEQGLFEEITASGFRFTNSDGGSEALGTWPSQNPYQADPEGTAVFVNKANSITTAERVDGRAFDFYSIDLTDLLNQGEAVDIEFTFDYADGRNKVEHINLGWERGLKTFEFNEADLRRVSWRTASSTNGWCQFDNFSASLSQGHSP
jgi:hypothetical protein